MSTPHTLVLVSHTVSHYHVSVTAALRMINLPNNIRSVDYFPLIDEVGGLGGVNKLYTAIDGIQSETVYLLVRTRPMGLIYESFSKVVCRNPYFVLMCICC